MKNKVLMLLMAVLFVIPQLFSQEVKKQKNNESDEPRKEFKYTISACPFGIAFGIFSINVERLVSDNHGQVFRVDYENVPKTYTNADIESNGWAFIYNYRYHFKPEMNSIFVGAYSRYRFFNGTGTIDGEEFDFKLPDFTLGLNLGKRWAWNSGLTATVAFGYGYSWMSRSLDDSTPEKEQAIDDWEKAYDFASPFYGEVSIGYSF